MSKTRVAVVFGGRSGEHEVSVVSAKNIIEAANKEKYEIIPIGITKDGKWLTGEKAIDQFQKNDYSGLEEVTLNTKSGSKELLNLKEDGTYEKLEVDIFFPALHGPYGEDGTIQGLFEMANVPYTGCGVMASSVGMDKLTTKALLDEAGIPVIPYLGFNKHAWDESPEEVVHRIMAELELPVFIKPSNMGSSVGVSKVTKKNELKKAIEFALEFDHRILVEKALNIRELECAILGNDDPKASRVGEVLVGGEFYDYNDKYVDGKSSTKVPADIKPQLEKTIQAQCIKAYKLIDGAGLSRCDTFYDKHTGEIYINEINTFPGFTEISMYPKMWDASGVKYADLIDKIIQLGLKKYDEKQLKKVSFDEAGDWFK
ncbi:D-alanine--D-alanine ligase family protein [Patescibacteria group bacterium]